MKIYFYLAALLLVVGCRTEAEPPPHEWVAEFRPRVSRSLELRTLALALAPAVRAIAPN
jgi:Tfp pilus assembly protein PilP